MGRPEAPLDTRGGPLQEFAARLRRLRADSGGRSYRQLAKAANFAPPTLARAASGRSFPSWEVTRGYVAACGADPDQWRYLWATTARLIGRDGAGAAAPGAARAGLPVRQLPADLPDFVGRAAECDRLRAVAQRPVPPGVAGRTPAVVVISGPGGVGKTTLAVHVAHQVADQYPDGQLFADLRGHDAHPATPAEVATRLLAALALPADHRVDPVTAFRSAVAGRRLLIVLDNAANEEQASPLLPDAIGSLVIVTSRQALTALRRARPVRLDVLDHQAAARLLTQIAGVGKAGHSAAIAAVAKLCGRLPLALRVAGPRLAGDPGTAGLLEERLRDEDLRLRHLAPGDRGLSAVFATSYRPLSGIQRHVFRGAGLFPGSDFSVAALVALTERNAADVEHALRRLADASLIQPAGPGRYRMHDLLRRFALERDEAESHAAELPRAIRRLAGWYLLAVDAADRTLMPARGRPAPLPQPPARLPSARFVAVSPTTWYDAEHANLIAVIRAAAGHGHHDIAWRLAVAMRGLLELRGDTADWVAVHQVGWASARALGDREAEGWILEGMGTGHWHGEQYAEAIDCYQQALEIRTKFGDDRAVAELLNNLGGVYGAVGRYAEAIDCLRDALAIRDRLGDEQDKSLALNGLGHLLHEQGMCADALPYLEEALRIRRALGNRGGEAASLHCLGDTFAGLGQMAEALTCLKQALTTFRQLGNRYGEAVALHSIGSACLTLGRPGYARRYLRSAISRYTELGQRTLEAAAREQLAATAPAPTPARRR